MRRLTLLAALAALFAADAGAAECTCRARGQDHAIGTTLCLSTGGGQRLATCGMLLNNTTWEFSSTPCEVSASAPGAVDTMPRASQASSVADGTHRTASLVRRLRNP